MKPGDMLACQASTRSRKIRQERATFRQLMDQIHLVAAGIRPADGWLRPAAGDVEGMQPGASRQIREEGDRRGQRFRPATGYVRTWLVPEPIAHCELASCLDEGSSAHRRHGTVLR